MSYDKFDEMKKKGAANLHEQKRDSLEQPYAQDAPLEQALRAQEAQAEKTANAPEQERARRMREAVAERDVRVQGPGDAAGAPEEDGAVLIRAAREKAAAAAANARPAQEQ